MTKRRSRRKRRSREKPTSGHPVSSTATRVAERIVAAGPGYFADNFIRLMQGSVVLQREKEFANFYLEPVPLLEAAARCFPRFNRRAKRVARRGEEGVTPIYDDYRIAVLDELDTPQLRQQLQSRLERCVERLKRGDDEAKIEASLFLSVLISDEEGKRPKRKKTLPLGLCGLVTAIYEDSFDRAMEGVPEARSIVGDDLYELLWCAKHSQEDMAAITAVTEQISAFEALAERLRTDPVLARAWKRQERIMIEDLQWQMVYEGVRFGPDLFTTDEVKLVMDKMERRHWNKPWSLARYFTSLALVRIVGCIRETLDELLTPQRVAEIIEWFQSAGQQCLEADDERLRSLVPYIQATICHLQSGEMPSQNEVVSTLFLQQFLTAASGQDALSLRWRRFFERLEKSRLLRRVSGMADL